MESILVNPLAFSVYGRVMMIYWCSSGGGGDQYAIIIERLGSVTWWVLWHHTGVLWLHQEFAENDEREAETWSPIHGIVSRSAAIIDGRDVHMVRELVESHNQFVWIVYVGTEEGAEEVVQYRSVLQLWTPVRPHWNTPGLFDDIMQM